MKKIAVLFLCLIMLFCTGCAGKKTSSDSEKANGDYIVSKGDYGAGLEMKKGDVAFRWNLGTVDNDLVVIDRRAGRINDKEDIKALI